jgi:hypothetical protein
MFQAHVLKVLLASPSDTKVLRDGVERSLHTWNTERAEAASVMLLPRRWETAAVPLLTGGDGQSVINAQLVDDADIVIVIFHAMLGSATPRAASGTAEELAHAHAAGKPVHVYFSNMPLDRDHDRAQLAALDEFKKFVRELGLYGSFDTAGDLENEVRRAIERDLQDLDLAAPTVKTTSAASLAASYKYRREPDSKGRMRTKGERLVVTNVGSAVAQEVTLSLHSLEEGLEAPTPFSKPVPFTLPPGGEYAVPLMTYAGTAIQVRVDFEWVEDERPRSSSHSVSFI